MQQISIKRVKGETQPAGEYNPLRVVSKIKIWPYEKWNMQNPDSVLESKTHKIL